MSTLINYLFNKMEYEVYLPDRQTDNRIKSNNIISYLSGSRDKKKEKKDNCP